MTLGVAGRCPHPVLVALARSTAHTGVVETSLLVRTVVGALLSACALTLAVPPSPAQAHQPVRLTAADRTPAQGPLLVDGTVSFAVYAMVRSGDARGFRVGMKAGQRLEVQLLIPDSAPANRLPAAKLPLVTVIDPAGRRQVLVNDERTPFYEPYSGTSYLYLARLDEPSRAGTYQVIVTGRSSTKVPLVVGVGYREVPGVVRD